MKKEEIPPWHQEIIRKRLELCKANPEQVLDFDTVIEEFLNAIKDKDSKG